MSVWLVTDILSIYSSIYSSEYSILMDNELLRNHLASTPGQIFAFASDLANN